MRQSRLLSAALVAVALVACGKKQAPPPPPTQPRSTPATPPPAPPSQRGDVVAQTSDYDKIKAAPIDDIERMGLLQEIHFDLDRADLRDADKSVLSKNADTLKRLDFLRITVEGHCDDRGTVEYNLALGERRAKGAYDYLVSLGVPADRLKTVSYGKEIPLCRDASEDCWARNRRDHFTVTGKTN
jgi:peptidoglycan-associated lipoprotein